MKSKAILPFDKEEMRMVRGKVKNKQYLSQIQSDMLGLRHRVDQLSGELAVEMGRMDHHFKNIMAEVQGLAKGCAEAKIVKVRRKR
jgi:hypothetical protein